jgi:hypothetical protein
MKFICTLDAVTVRVGEHSRTFRAGETVDLSAEAAPGVTWREALGEHAAAFTTPEIPKATAAAKKGQE